MCLVSYWISLILTVSNVHACFTCIMCEIEYVINIIIMPYINVCVTCTCTHSYVGSCVCTFLYPGVVICNNVVYTTPLSVCVHV